MTKTQTIAKIASIGLLGIFVAMLTPSSTFDTAQSAEFTLYGMLNMVQKDSMGNEVFSQTIHNQLTDQGEDYIIDQAFDTVGTALTAGDRIGSICIGNITATLIDDPAEREALDADDVSSGTPGQTLTLGATCIVDAVIDDSTTSTAVVGPLTFTSGTNLASTETINVIIICSGNSGADLSTFNECAGGANDIAFAVVDTADVTLSGTDTIDITYTFDIISATT